MSLETPVGAEDNSVLVDFIPDESVASPDETNRELLREEMRGILESLSERERMAPGAALRSRGRREPHAGGVWASSLVSPASASGRSRPKRCASCATPRAAAS